MPEKHLPARPDLDQYRKQAKDLLREARNGSPDALARFQQHHPQPAPLALTAAQLVLAREHGFESWPKFAAHIETLRIAQSIAALADPVAAFLIAATTLREDHASGTLEEANAILARYPQVARASIYTAAVLADESAIRAFLSSQPQLATAPGGPLGWDALTHLCFSRYLALDSSRSDAFVRTARVLLDAGAPVNTGWYETEFPPQRTFESAIYGAAGFAKHPGLTRLLLDHGADPNDEETPYHAPETYDNTTLQVLLESGKLNGRSKVWLLVRKADWHDLDGMRLALQHGADPNAVPRWGNTALQHSVLRDNSIDILRLLLDHGANPSLRNVHTGLSAASMAARRGRADFLHLLRERNIDPQFTGLDALIAACALSDQPAIDSLLATQPDLRAQLLAKGGTLLAQFSGTDNADGVRSLLDLGAPVDALYSGDGYFDIAPQSTALHVATWRGSPRAVKLLLERGAAVDLPDGKGRTALQRAVRACTDSYWKRHRTPEWIAPLLQAGATLEGIEIPTGYDAADALLLAHQK